MRPAHRAAQVLTALGAAIIMIVGALGIAAAPAQAASSSTLCRGFKDCSSKSRGNAGYAPVHRQSFWNMRAGHNCTNYVGYRLTHGGRLTDRPAGADDAHTWARAARAAGARVDRTPRVGSIAQWAAGHHGAGRTGHVAYVEAVRSDGSIVISEDQLGGTFAWRKLSKRSTAWPSAFIHFATSNGSPAGSLLWARSDQPGRIAFAGTAGEWDVPAGERAYTVSIGGPLGTPGAETFDFGTSFFRFERIKTVTTRGSTTIHVYARNTPGSRGSDTLLGVLPVTIG